MGRRHSSSASRINLKWSPALAYAVGLIASDGYISQDGRYISFVSNDRELVETFMSCLDLKKLAIGKNVSGSGFGISHRVQFGDVNFHKWLRTTGITPRKSKTISAVRIPDAYFFDFVRGVFDGDGSFYSYYDKRWKSSFMFYMIFASGSKEFVCWLRAKLDAALNIKGHVTMNKTKSVFQLKYAKKESLKIIKKVYYSASVPCLQRKRSKISKALRHEKATSAQVVKLVDTLP